MWLLGHVRGFCACFRSAAYGNRRQRRIVRLFLDVAMLWERRYPDGSTAEKRLWLPPFRFWRGVIGDRERFRSTATDYFAMPFRLRRRRRTTSNEQRFRAPKAFPGALCSGSKLTLDRPNFLVGLACPKAT
jgi:hypothetical protein